MPKKIGPIAAACALLGWALSSCGLDSVPYISPVPMVPPANISGSGVTDVLLTVTDGGAHFVRFAVFYRIYLSDVGDPSPDPSTFAQIHPTLAADYNHFRGIIDAIAPPADVTNVFNNRGFSRLALEGVNVNGGVALGSVGGTMDIDFAAIGRPPRLSLRRAGVTTEFYLRRAEERHGVGRFDPAPRFADPPNDRLPFFNHPYLLDRDNARPIQPGRPELEIRNDDAAPFVGRLLTEANAGNPMTDAYVLMYVVVEGRSMLTLPPTPVSSRPTFLGVFRLPPFS